MASDETTSAERGGNGYEQAQRISREMVRIMRETSGRGPTKARTTIGRDHVLVMFAETLTPGERVLIDNGHEGPVEDLRAAYQTVLRDEATAMIDDVLGREVIGFMSANHFNPDLAAEIFVLKPNGDGHAQGPEEAEHQEE
jgi:uncharacterized protein YbcI